MIILFFKFYSGWFDWAGRTTWRWTANMRAPEPSIPSCNNKIFICFLNILKTDRFKQVAICMGLRDVTKNFICNVLATLRQILVLLCERPSFVFHSVDGFFALCCRPFTRWSDPSWKCPKTSRPLKKERTRYFVRWIRTKMANCL